MKRTFSALLAVILLISCVPAVSSSRSLVTVTDADLIIYNYDSLTDGEASLLRSPYFVSSSHSFEAPENGLVTVDAKSQTIAAPDFTGSVTWRPVACRVVGADSVENVALADGEGHFSYSGNAYTVEVDYVADVSVDTAVQERLLNGAWSLVSAKDYADTLDLYSNYFNLVASNTAVFKSMTDPDYAGSYAVTDPETVAAITRLDEQSARNDGFLDVEILIYDYFDAPSKTEFILDRGAELQTLTSQTYSDIYAVNNDAAVKNVLQKVIGRGTPNGKKTQIALNAINTLISGIADAATNDWAILDADKNPLKAGLTAADYSALDGLVDAAAGAGYHGDAIKNPLKTDKVTVMANVNQFNVTVTLKASRITETTIDSATATALEDHSTVIQVLEGATPEQVEEAVAASGIENAALEAWVGIGTENYDRTTSELPAALAGDIEYTITYAPKTINVSYGFTTDLPTEVPYGYNMTLPLNEDDKLVYDYDIGGKAYLQGEVYTVTESVTVNRTEGKPWSVSKLNAIVADVYADDLTDAEEAALRTTALKGENVFIRIPEGEDGVVEVTTSDTGFTVTAADYPSGIPGITWKAVSGRAVKDGATVAEFIFEDGSAGGNVGGIDNVEVRYETTITTIEDEKVIEALNKPAALSKQLIPVKENIDLLDSLYDQFGKLDQTTLNQIQIGINGSEMSDESKAAADFMSENCVDKSISGLYIYEYLTAYRKFGLPYLFEDGVYEKICTQTRYLADSLYVINSDPELMQLLIDIGYEDYFERIGEIVSIICDVDIYPLPDGIDGCARDALALTDALLAVDTDRTFDAPLYPLTISATFTKGAPGKAAVNLDGVLFGYFDMNSSVSLPSLPSYDESGVTVRFFSWLGENVTRGDYDPASSSDNKRDYSVALGTFDISLTSLYYYVGDVNGDGLVTISDLVSAKRMLAGFDEYGDIGVEALDIDGDGLTVIRDLSLLKVLLAG